MASFPTLKTGAVAQYPASRAFQYSNQALRFLDATEQRYRLAGSPLHQWEIKLDQLDPGEIGVLQNFFVNQQGEYLSFSFTDPWDGTIYPNCSIDGVLEAGWQDDFQTKTSLVVKEIRT